MGVLAASSAASSATTATHDVLSMLAYGSMPPNPWWAMADSAMRTTYKSVAGRVPDRWPGVAAARTPPSQKRKAWTNVNGQCGLNRNIKATSDRHMMVCRAKSAYWCDPESNAQRYLCLGVDHSR